MGEYAGPKYIPAFIQYCAARLRQSKQDKFHRDAKMKYMLYSSDCLRLCSENIAKISGGSYKAVKFSEIIFPETAEKEEEKNENEVISDIRTRLAKLGGKR